MTEFLRDIAADVRARYREAACVAAIGAGVLTLLICTLTGRW